MSIIGIEITISDKGVATYSSSSKQVASDGTITIVEGDDATITFAPASGQTWQFQSPWITIVPNTPGVDDVTVSSTGAAAITIIDNNPTDTKASAYTYTLQTTVGVLDPAILNKGRR
jgi:hypothetical protein